MKRRELMETHRPVSRARSRRGNEDPPGSVPSCRSTDREFIDRQPAVTPGQPGTLTLSVTCPVCQYDDGDALGVTGFMDDRQDSAVVMTCFACSSVYLSPIPISAEIERRSEVFCSVVQGALTRARRAERPGHSRLVCEFSDLALQSALRSRSTFDEIVLLFCLESAADVRKLLTHAVSLLNPGGWIDVVATNPRSCSFRVFGGRHWFGFDFPHHRQFLSQRGLEGISRQAGLRLVSARTRSAGSGWMVSAQNWLQDWSATSAVQACVAGSWGLPRLVSWCIERAAVSFGRGALMEARLERSQ